MLNAVWPIWNTIWFVALPSRYYALSHLDFLQEEGRRELQTRITQRTERLTYLNGLVPCTFNYFV